MEGFSGWYLEGHRAKESDAFPYNGKGLSEKRLSSEQLVKHGRTGTVTLCTEASHFATGLGRHPVTQHHGMYGMGTLSVDAGSPFRF